MTETALATPRAHSEDQTRKVYIVLSQTGTVLSRILKLYTRAPYNHSSIALTAVMRETPNLRTNASSDGNGTPCG